jgi:phage tail sheath gpL-like
MTVASILGGRVPQFVFSIALALGISTVSGERAILVATPNAAAAAGVDDTVYEITSEAAAITYIGQGYPGHRVIKKMIAAEPSSKIYAVIVGNNAATAASKTCVLGGVVSAAGTLKLQVADEILEIPVTVAETLDNIGAGIVAEGTATPDAPVVITYAVGPAFTVTITAKQVGLDSNLLRYRFYDLPTGLTITNSSGTLAGGAGTPAWSAAYAAAFGGGVSFDFVIPCTNETAALTVATTGLRDRITANAQPGISKLMNAVIAHTTTGADARTAADSYDLGLNTYAEGGWYWQIIDLPYLYAEPWCCAGIAAVQRAFATGGSKRNDNWPGIWPRSVVLKGLSPFGTDVANYPSKTDWNSDLSNGVSPAAYDYATQTVRLVGSVTCKHVVGGAPSYKASWTNHIDVMTGLAPYLTTRCADRYPNHLITDDVDGRPPETLGSKSVTPSMLKKELEDGYADLVSLEWVDETYTTGSGATLESHSVYDLFAVERDASNPSMCNARVACFVRDWFLGAGIMYEEYGTG